MFKKFDFTLYNILSNVKRRDTIAIYGTSKEALEIKKYIYEKRKDVNIAFFVEYQVGEKQYQDGIKVIDFKTFIKEKDKVDCIIIAKRDNFHAMTQLFAKSNINFVEVSEKDLQTLGYLHFEDLKEMFEEDEDRERFEVIFISSLLQDKNYYYRYIEEHKPSLKNNEYTEFLMKNRIKTIVDTGENNGYNSMVFQNEIKGVEKIYCFDALHDYVSNGLILPRRTKELTFYKIIQFSEKVEMVGRILWDCENAKVFLRKGLKTITLDIFRAINKRKIDFIKFDIDALELSVLKGCVRTIKKDRPQLAFRIFEMPARDYTEIMLFLKNILRNYTYKVGYYDEKKIESFLYCIPKELYY